MRRRTPDTEIQTRTSRHEPRSAPCGVCIIVQFGPRQSLQALIRQTRAAATHALLGPPRLADLSCARRCRSPTPANPGAGRCCGVPRSPGPAGRARDTDYGEHLYLEVSLVLVFFFVPLWVMGVVVWIRGMRLFLARICGGFVCAGKLRSGGAGEVGKSLTSRFSRWGSEWGGLFKRLHDLRIVVDRLASRWKIAIIPFLFSSMAPGNVSKIIHRSLAFDMIKKKIRTSVKCFFF